MSGAGDSRPYRNLSTFEIEQRIRSLESDYRSYEKERRKLSAIGATDDAQAESYNMQMVRREIDGFQEELRIREGRGDRREPGSNLVTVACNCQRSRRFKLPGKVYDLGRVICGNCNQPFKLTLRSGHRYHRRK
jgi:hypothetical protein